MCVCTHIHVYVYTYINAEARKSASLKKMVLLNLSSIGNTFEGFQ